MEISASTTTTDVDASVPERDTMAATSARPIAAATMMVSAAIRRFVREPAISQLSTSAPVPSVPNGCAADGEAHALKPSVSSSEYGVQTKDTAAVSSHSPMTIVAYLPLALAQMDETTAPVVLIVASAGVVDADSSPSVAFGVCVGFDLLMRSPSPKRRRRPSAVDPARDASYRPRVPTAGRMRPIETVRFAPRPSRGCRHR